MQIMKETKKQQGELLFFCLRNIQIKHNGHETIVKVKKGILTLVSLQTYNKERLIKGPYNV